MLGGIWQPEKESMCDLRIFFHVSERKIQEAAVGG